MDEIKKIFSMMVKQNGSLAEYMQEKRRKSEKCVKNY